MNDYLQTAAIAIVASSVCIGAVVAVENAKDWYDNGVGR